MQIFQVMVNKANVPDALLIDEIKYTQAYKDYVVVFEGVEVLMIQPKPVGSTQGTIRTPRAIRIPTLKNRILEEDLKNLVEADDESSGSEFADTMLLSDEDFGDRIEPGSHKEKPKDIIDDEEKKDDDEKIDEKKDDDDDNNDDDDDNNDQSLIKTQEMGMVNDVIKKERESSQDVVPTLVSQKFGAYASKLIEELFKIHMQNMVLNVHPTTSIEACNPHSIIDEPFVCLISLNKKEEKKIIDLEEIAKFCDATLEKVLKEVKLTIFKIKFKMKAPSLGELDLKIIKAYEREIIKRLMHRKQMRRWESFEVIENGATLPKTQVVKGVMIEMPITTAKEKAQRRLESDQAEKGPNYALMAFSSLNSKSESFTGLDEFVNKPVVQDCKAKSSEEETKGNPQMNLQDQGVIDSRCSRHMTWNISYLTDYKEIDGGYVAFRGNLKGGKIIKKGVTDDYSRFTWVFFLATKNETGGILKSFIIGIENPVDHKVKVIRYDNGTEFNNKEMNQFCEMKEAVNTACYVQNRVLVVKPYNKTPYELFHGRTPTLSFMRPFRCPVNILNTIDHLGTFDGKADEGFFVGYSLSSKAFRVFNSRKRIVEENLHIRFSENTPNIVGSGLDWLFYIDSLTRTINYEPIVSDPKSSHDDGSKPSSDDERKVDEDPRKENECNDQEKEDNVNSTNNVNTISSTINVDCTNKDNELLFDPNMHALEDVSIFKFSSNNKDDDHPLDQVIEDLQFATQTRKMSKNLEEHAFVSTIKQRTNHKDLQNCLFACFLSQEEPRKIEEEVYVCQPPGFKDPDFLDRVYKTMGFKEGKLTRPYSLKGTKKKDGTFISQDKYVAAILKKFGFIKVKTASTPMETQKPLLKDEDGEEVDVHMYRSMIGSLMYLTSSRLDIRVVLIVMASNIHAL
nr:hypothetical protein [Tanacetum cinerariifolium]